MKTPADRRDTPYDEAHLESEDGSQRRLTPSQFEALPLHERVSALLHKRVRFFRAGAEVPAKVALKTA